MLFLIVFHIIVSLSWTGVCEAPYSPFLHSRFHYSRIEKMRSNFIRGLRFLYSRIESKYRQSNNDQKVQLNIFLSTICFLISSSRNISPITPYKLPFHIHGFCIRGIFTERIPREKRSSTVPFYIHGFCIRGIFTERIPRE
uniref:SFRICE_010305 n=1 Tax=Spodoptera frugiperda TaxID=7108 RepID=A0A2H1V4R7_SPOFR